MTADEQAISIHPTPDVRKRLEKAAGLTHQSPAAFIEQVADEHAREVLLHWAVRRYRTGDTTFSLLAGETGLTVADIMYAMGTNEADEAAASFLARARAVAEAHSDPDLLRMAQEVVAKTWPETL